MSPIDTRSTEQTEAFDIKAARKKPGFLDFVAKFDNSEEIIKDPVKAKEYFETFEEKGKVAAELKKVLKEQIYKSIKVQLTDAELAPIDAYLEKEIASGNLKIVEKITGLIAEYKKFPEIIKQKNEQIEKLKAYHELGNKAKDAEKEANKFKTWANFFKRKMPYSKTRAAWKQARENRNEASDNFLEMQDELENAEVEIVSMQAAENQKKVIRDKYKVATDELFHGIDEVQAIFKLAYDKMNWELNKAMDPKNDHKTFAEGLAYFEEIEDADDAEDGVVKYLNKLTDETGKPASREDYKKIRAEQLLFRVIESTKEIVGNMQTHEIAYSTVNKKLKEKFGKGVNAKIFFETEEKAVRSVIDKTTDQGKKLALFIVLDELATRQTA